MADVPINNGVVPNNGSTNVVANSVVTPSNSVLPKKPTGSPWDEELPEPNIQQKGNPKVVGSLDQTPVPESAQTKTLKLPENVEEKVGEKIPATNFIGNTPPGAEAPKPPVPPENQPGIKPRQGFFGSLFKKSAPNTPPVPPLNMQPPVSFAPQAVSPPPLLGVNPTPLAKNSPQPLADQRQKKAPTNHAVGGPIKKILILIPSLLLVFGFAVALTEIGLLSIGVEKIYGKLNIEQLWGGLSINTESALGRSALEMQRHSDYKITGDINITIDKSIKSDIVSPLLSVATNNLLAKDESVGLGIAATKTQSSDDYYYYNSNSNNSNLNSNNNKNSNLNSNSNSNINSNYNSNANLNANVNQNTNNSNHSSAESYSGTKAVEGKLNLKTTENGTEAEIKINNASGSTIKLINSANKLLVKSSGDIIYSDDKTKWSEYTINSLKNKTVQKDIFSLRPDAGFSVSGQRVGNEKIGESRCFKYHINSLEIGDSLASLGITSDLVPTLSGDVWIGIKDKLIHRIDIKITTPVSSAVRMVSIDAVFSDFDVKNTLTTVSNEEKTAGKIGAALTGDAKRKADIDSILVALKQYKTENKSYPISSELLKLNVSDNAITKILVPRYLLAMPQDPQEGWYYAYKSADGKSCSVSSRLENQSDPTGSLVNNVLLYLKYNND